MSAFKSAIANTAIKEPADRYKGSKTQAFGCKKKKEKTETSVKKVKVRGKDRKNVDKRRVSGNKTAAA